MIASIVLAAALFEPVDLARPEMGTINSPHGGEGCHVSTGNLYPMIARPWGFGGWSPQSRGKAEGRWFYDYTDEKIYGIRYTRQPSPWIGDHGSWNFLPVTGAVAGGAAQRSSWYSHKTETVSPAEYSVYLADFDTSVSIAPSLHGAVAKVVYPSSKDPGVVFNPFKDGEVELSADGTLVTGVSRWDANRRGLTDGVAMKFAVRLPCKAVGEKLADGALLVRFPATARGDVVELHIANSFISKEQAIANLSETAGRNYATVRAEARAEWNGRLGRIRVKTEDHTARATFYTCFYRTMLFPLAVWERTPDGKVVHWSPATGEVRPGHYYAGTGFWDTFRALFPLLNFLAPEMNAKMMEGLENCWKEYGWLPEWSSPGLSNCMIGNNSASVVADAWLSGIRGAFDIEELWKALVHGANGVHPKLNAVGRLGFDAYNEKGYVPRDIGINESAARTLEYAYDDWCIARLAEVLGKRDEAALYRRRSANWRNVFDPARRIAVGRNADGTFNAGFNRFSWGGDFTEGCALHYTWSVFHDVPGLMAAMGGDREFERRLDEVFQLPTTEAEYSYYKCVIHEQREMQIMNMGQYAHGNQPIQHMISLYDWCGAWAKAQWHAREVMDRLYRPTPDGYCGDEDNGQTSAWYVWSALGMYPVCPGSGEYALGAPRFDEIEVTLPDGKRLSIAARGAENRRVFRRSALNGADTGRPFVTLDGLRRGGRLEFDVGGNVGTQGTLPARLEGAHGAKAAAYIQERVLSDEAKGEIYEEAVNAFRTHYDDTFDHPERSGWERGKKGLWQGEYWGKSMLAAASVAELTGDGAFVAWLRAKALAFVAEYQRADGYLCSYRDENFIGDGDKVFCWNLWGRKYTMWALIEIARLSGERRLLEAAARVMDHEIVQLEKGGIELRKTGFFAGLPSMSVLKPLQLLYRATGNEKYREFARGIVRDWDRADGARPNLIANAFTDRLVNAWYPGRGWPKAYEMMSCLEGLVDWAVHEGDDRVLDAVTRVADKLERGELNAVGGVGYFDHFTHAAGECNATTEPCDVVHWIRLNRDLFLARDDPHRLDLIEFAYLNAFLGGVYRDGRWSAHSVRSHGSRHRTAPHQVGMKYHHCCVDNMPRTFADIASIALSSAPGGVLSVNFYSDGEFTCDGAKVLIRGGYPMNDEVMVTLSAQKAGNLRFRVPSCFDSVSFNGERATDSWFVAAFRPGENVYRISFSRMPKIVPWVTAPDAEQHPETFECVNENPEMKGRSRKTMGTRILYGPVILAKGLYAGTAADEIDCDLVGDGAGWKASVRPIAATRTEGAWELRLEKDGSVKTLRVGDFATIADTDDPSNHFSIWF